MTEDDCKDGGEYLAKDNEGVWHIVFWEDCEQYLRRFEKPCFLDRDGFAILNPVSFAKLPD